MGKEVTTFGNMETNFTAIKFNKLLSGEKNWLHTLLLTSMIIRKLSHCIYGF